MEIIFSLRKMFSFYYSKYDELLRKEESEYKLIDFCEENFLNYKTLFKIHERFLDLFRKSRKLIKFESEPQNDYSDFMKILFCFSIWL